MERKVRKFIQSNNLTVLRNRVLVALSGGADSVALLLVMKQLGYDVSAAHCNFHLRDDESDRDERFCQQLCNEQGIALHRAHFDTREYAAMHKMGIEEAARHLRYSYFAQLCHDMGYKAVAVAHHRDDSVETILLNLLRGTGIDGLLGLRPEREITINRQTITVIRPLLCVGRKEIEEWLREKNQSFVTDSTNLEAEATRNKIRLQLLPVIDSINPQARKNILRTAKNLGYAAESINSADFSHSSLFSQVNDLLEEEECIEGNENLVKEKILEEKRLFGEANAENIAANNTDSEESLKNEERLFRRLQPLGFTGAQIEQLHQCLVEQHTGAIFSSPLYDLVVIGNDFRVEQRQEPLPTTVIPETGTYIIGKETDYYGIDAHLRLKVSTTDEVWVMKDAHKATIDFDKVVFPLTVRTVREGDRFQPFGMKGTKLLSDFLTDQKVDVLQRRRQLLVEDANGEILWVIGRRTSEACKIDSTTRKMLILEYKGI